VFRIDVQALPRIDREAVTAQLAAGQQNRRDDEFAPRLLAQEGELDPLGAAREGLRKPGRRRDGMEVGEEVGGARHHAEQKVDGFQSEVAERHRDTPRMLVDAFPEWKDTFPG